MVEITDDAAGRPRVDISDRDYRVIASYPLRRRPRVDRLISAAPWPRDSASTDHRHLYDDGCAPWHGGAAWDDYAGRLVKLGRLLTVDVRVQ